MKRLGIVEFVMSAGGVERVLRGLARAFLEIPEARGWDITFLLGRYNSGQQRCEWPHELTGPNLRVEWLGEKHAASRILDRIAGGQGIWGTRLGRRVGTVGAEMVRNRVPRRWAKHVGNRAALVAAASTRFDVLYFTYPVGMDAPAGLEAAVVATPQDFNYLHFQGAETRARRFLERTTVSWMERADRLLLTSHAMLDELRREYPVYAPKAQVVPLGIDADPIPPSPRALESVRVRRGLPPEFVLVPGWVAPHKNQLVIVDAVRMLREKGASIPIVFVGPNTAGLALERSAGSLYAERVWMALRQAGMRPGRDYLALGYVTDDEIACLYRLATVCVVASLYEGFGLPALEARRAACPTILSAIPPFEEQNRLVGAPGGTFDPRDAVGLAERIDWVLCHRAEVVASARSAAESVTRVYDWRKTASSYLATFEAVLHKRRAAAVGG